MKEEQLENLLKTENEHWNDFAHRLLCETTENALFHNAIQPLKCVDIGINLLVEHSQNPNKGVHLLLTEISKLELTISQQVFVYEWINKYLAISEFDGNMLTQSKALLQSHLNRLKKESEPDKPLVQNIREVLKAQIQKELQQLPQTLNALEPERRLNIICKLIPFVLPKVETIDSESGEPGEFRLR